MDDVGVIGRLSKCMVAIVMFMIPSMLIVTHAFADNTGGYPWSDAVTINQSTYDWGYSTCQPAIQNAGRCNTHVQYLWGVAYMQSDPWGYDLRNCTSYVAWRVNNDYGISVAGWGNANNWDNAAITTYPVDNNPTIGDIAVWEGLYGHVAFVTDVHPDNSFEVDQYNNVGTGEFSHQLRTSASHFIHIKPQQNAVAPTGQELLNTSIQTPVLQSQAVSAVKPEPVSYENVDVPEPSKTEYTSNPFKSADEVEFLLEYAPNIEEINVFAVVSSNTISGKIEVNQSTLADGNSKFQKTKITSMEAQPPGSTKFVLADYNNDSVLDLYAIKTNNTKSQMTEITVLNGIDDYKSIILDTTSTISTSNENSIYKVADKNNDSVLDIFKITNNPETTKTKFEIIDGADKYTNSLQSWNTNKSTNNFDVFVGDDNRDGKSDIYVVNVDENIKQIQIDILDETTEYLLPSRNIIINKDENLSKEAYQAIDLGI